MSNDRQQIDKIAKAAIKAHEQRQKWSDTCSARDALIGDAIDSGMRLTDIARQTMARLEELGRGDVKGVSVHTVNLVAHTRRQHDRG